MSDSGGEDNVYVEAWPDTRGRLRVSSQGGAEPVWRRDGREIFYRSGRGLYSVSVDFDAAAEQVVLGIPDLLFEGEFLLDSFGNSSYDVAPEGDRFLMVDYSDVKGLQQARLIVNWFTELERLVPGS